MKEPRIDPKKLLAFFRQLYSDLQDLESALDKLEPARLSESLHDKISIKLDGILSDVGDQLVLLPKELEKKPKQWRQLGPEHDVINIPAQTTRAFVK